ncbi:hypothetical protein BUALT_Bualt02G0172500 [Buddleja alternifolia]|uniref:Transcription factor CBF/NF-Y/archaeal histone domain-containing protein n=1 Tax=Buddleja alternifolia TaxID=168488 RepID=A0AAV6Y7P1_9LAMI|nr:hypothetical protein BUALT_Bualt02G0172500 [Buddleja alternifolia]
MQADEEVGKIAMVVPLLVSLELFLQDLCDRTYEITLNRGAKTVNSLHLKQCVQSFNVFDLLKDTVSKHETGQVSSSGRGRGRGSRTLDRELIVQCEKSEDALDISHQNCENKNEFSTTLDNIASAADSRTISEKDLDQPVRNFDLNVNLNENGDSTPTLAGAPSETSTKPAPDMKHEDIRGWSSMTWKG